MKKVSLSLIVDGEIKDKREIIDYDEFVYYKGVEIYKQLVDVVKANNYSPCKIITEIEEIKERRI